MHCCPELLLGISLRADIETTRDGQVEQNVFSSEKLHQLLHFAWTSSLSMMALVQIIIGRKEPNIDQLYFIQHGELISTRCSITPFGGSDPAAAGHT